MEPLACQPPARGVRERGLKQSQVAPLETRHLGRAHFAQHRGHLARRKIADALHVAAVLITERRVREQVCDHLHLLGFEHGGARRPDALHIHEWSRQIQGKRRLLVVYNAVSCLDYWKGKPRSFWAWPTAGVWLTPSHRRSNVRARVSCSPIRVSGCRKLFKIWAHLLERCTCSIPPPRSTRTS